MGLISFILKHLPGFLAGLVIFGALAYVEGLRLTIAHDKSVIAQANATIKTDNASIQAQNAATQALANESAMTQAAAAKAIQQAQAGRVNVEKQLAKLQAVKDGVDQCAAIQALRSASGS